MYLVCVCVREREEDRMCDFKKSNIILSNIKAGIAKYKNK